MGRRYYCDYCDKTFIDELEARKKHLQSSHHIKLRNLHYELYRDPEVILKEEIVKTPCRRFMQNGTCQFAGNCKYTHYSQEELWEIKQQIDYEEYLKSKKLEEDRNVPSLEAWLDKYSEKHVSKIGNANVNTKPFWSYPDQLETRPDLPPSLKKLRPEYFTYDNFEEWG